MADMLRQAPDGFDHQQHGQDAELTKRCPTIAHVMVQEDAFQTIDCRELRDRRADCEDFFRPIAAIYTGREARPFASRCAASLRSV